MFSYKLLVGFTIIAIGLTNPITNILLNQPERCCLPKQYSSKFNLIIESTLPDGTIHTSNVIISCFIFQKKMFFFPTMLIDRV
jgi:hypothetical protein